MRTVVFLFVLSLCFACAKKTEKIVETYEDGSPKKIEVYQQNLKIEEKVFYPNKQLKYRGEFKNNMKDGNWVYYYEDGKIWSEGMFLKDKRNGITKVYYPNGTLRYRGEYNNGEKTGIWHFYDDNGKEIHTIDYSSKFKP